MVPKCSIMGPKWSQMVPNAPQMVPKWSKWSPNALQILPKWSKNGVKIGPWSVPRLEPHLGIDFGRFGAPFWLPKGPQKSTKIYFFSTSIASQSSKSFSLTFRFHFGQISKLFLRPFWYWRSMQTEKAHVQIHCIFTMDYQHFYQATSSENQAKSIQSDVKCWYRFGYDFRCDFVRFFVQFLIKNHPKSLPKGIWKTT